MQSNQIYFYNSEPRPPVRGFLL